MNQIISDRFCSAIAPNIFDAYSNTDLLLPLVLGNLLSKKLWDFSTRIQNKLAAPDQTEGQAGTSSSDPLKLIRAIQHQLDRHFKHLHPSEVASTYGELNLHDERLRLGTQTVDTALRLIETTFRQRIQDGSLPPEAIAPLVTRIEQNRYPAFYYTNFDIVLANRALTGRRSSAPMGLTSCLDEVAIFAALAMTMPTENVDNVIALTSASHYTAFGWMRTGETWWLYGKNKLYSGNDWSQIVNDQFNGDAQSAFDYYLKDMDRIVSVAGTFDLSSGNTSITEEHTSLILEKLEQFFGRPPIQITAALTRPIKRTAESPLAPVLRKLLGTQSLEQAQRELLVSGDPELLQVLYSFRSLNVPHPAPYFDVARHQPFAKALGLTLSSRDEAVDVIRGVEGSESIFNDRSRIAMPDETLRLRTGTDRDKALLLHILFEHIDVSHSLNDPPVTLFATDDSFVCGNDFCISLTTLDKTVRPTENILWQYPA